MHRNIDEPDWMQSALLYVSTFVLQSFMLVVTVAADFDIFDNLIIW